jgi:uncharacterized protein YndB with AHSA1/START domain
VHRIAVVTMGGPALIAGCAMSSGEPQAPTSTSVVLAASALIAAPPERIWSILVDLPAYREWNPWLTAAAGTIAPGADVRVRVVLNGATRDADHVVLAVEPGHKLCWRDAGWSTIFVYGQRCRWLDRRSDGSVYFSQELLLDGPFAELAERRYGASLRAGMAAETAALRQRAESAWAPPVASATLGE